ARSCLPPAERRRRGRFLCVARAIDRRRARPVSRSARRSQGPALPGLAMKILLVHHAYPPESTGGSELYTEALARRLAREHEVTVLHRAADPARPDHDVRSSTRDGVRVVSLNNLH